MHELALAEGVLAVVLDAAGDEPVRRIRLSVGVRQAVVPDSMQFCFQLAAEGTSAADAALELIEVPARLACHACGAESERRAPPFLCLQCGADDVILMAGDELLVDAVELRSGWLYRPGAAGDAPVTVEVPPSHLAEHAREAAGAPPHHAPTAPTPAGE
jgi:hydrogenase nickel incorporation protein HypA/HybF